VYEALSHPIERDPLKMLEKIQQFDTDDNAETTNLTYSSSMPIVPPDVFDKIEREL
jgi:hypothetical protein